jgi:hypothetical protein
MNLNRPPCQECGHPTQLMPNPVAFLTGKAFLRYCPREGCLWEMQLGVDDYELERA